MERRSIEAIIASLNTSDVRYLVVGGLAVIAHGYLRTTQDIDLVLALDPDNALRGVRALAGLGYRPVVPVALEAFADEATREEWALEKGAVVLTLHSDAHRTATVDLFIREPFDFATAHANALIEEIAPGLPAWFVGFEDLVGLKRAAGRPQDLADIHELEEIRLRLREERDPTG